ncbi:MAG: FtsW/RodA/SpoVE family cell cycle protein [Tenericutes bacterium]|nr:FtsW/RodA/SpoVE family cell cycle protein [Mycoplasmatota bacterium]MDY3800566.1 FtsW/RodA/SpoVE family cell cycle protein [Bacilli bacterium]
MLKKIDYFLLCLLIIMNIFSLIGLFNYDKILLYKQIIWILIGIVIILFITVIDNNIIYKNSHIIYIICNILLLLLLFFAQPINGSKCWFKIPGLGNIQISEFTKISLIIFLSDYLSKNNKIIFKSIIIVLIPSILTFLEPDTGAVLMYSIIVLAILFALKISYKWYLGGTLIITSCIFLILYLYFFNINLFIKILGSSFFLRIERLIDWFNKEGMQLNNSMMAISIGGLLGTGINKNLVYFPEGHTDFIFATISSHLGFLGSFILIITILLFDIRIINLAIQSKSKRDSLLLVGFISVLFYQQFQNIGMTFGILPITGITLPFISYGGSSILSYSILVGMYMNIYNKKMVNYLPSRTNGLSFRPLPLVIIASLVTFITGLIYI